MTLKLLLSLFFILWSLAEAEEYTNHWLAEDVSALEFCSHDGYKNESCICNVDYSGNFCLQRKCRNFGFNGNQGIDGNGFVGFVDRCICPPGFLGRNCEPVSCVNGNNQIYVSSKNEKAISLLASYNSQMEESWKTNSIGDIICNYTEYNRNINYNFDNLGISISANDTLEKCKNQVDILLDPDTCTSDDTTPSTVPCQQLNIENLNTLVQNSPPNSIVFVVTNMKLPDSQVEGSLTETILATAIARKIQINVVVYNNTLPMLLANDPSLIYLQRIAAATLGTFVLPSVDKSNEQYNVVSTLLSNWDNDIGVSTVFSDGTTLPVDQTTDLYVSAQTYYGEDLVFNTDSSTVSTVSQTNFWKLYKLPAGSFPPFLKISGQVEGTKVLVYSSSRLKVYSAFTSDPTESISIVDAAYSVSVLEAAYPLVFRIESDNTVLQASDINSTFGQTDTIKLGSFFVNRSCQFNIATDATCNSVGPSVATIVTNKLQAVSFPIYCASLNYGRNIYNKAYREIVSFPHIDKKQSLAKDYTCANEIDHERTGERTFVIIAENSKDNNSNKSSVDNVFRNKNSIFYQLTQYLSQNPNQYQNYVAGLNTQSSFTTEQALTYNVFLTKLMKVTSTSPSHDEISGNYSVTELLNSLIHDANPYSDIFFIVNNNILVEDNTSIKQALAQKRSRLYTIFVQTYMNTTNDEYRYLNEVSVSSGGIAIRINDYYQMSTFFNQYYPALVNNDIVAKGYSENQKPGIALNNVYLTDETYYLLVTNLDLSGDEPVDATVSIDGVTSTRIFTLGELEVFELKPSKAGVYSIPISFVIAGLAQQVNAILLSSSASQDFVSLSFLDKNNLNRNDVDYGFGAFLPFLYSSTPFGPLSELSITYSDAVNPAKPVYTGKIQQTTDCGFTYYVNYTNYPWVCSISGGLYHFKIDLVSDNKNITRTFPITCSGSSSGQCLNGGTETNSGTGCLCPIQWTGSYCQSPVCLNGGTLTSADTCECVQAFKGDFCEISKPECVAVPSLPDYRSDLSSLIIVADTQALSFGNLTSGLDITGVPITVILYGEEITPRVVQSTTNGKHLVEVIGNTASTLTPMPETVVSLYQAINLALDTLFTNRALIVVYTANPDNDIDSDMLIRLAAKRAEIRVISTATTEPSQNYLTLSLVGNGIPALAKNPSDFEKYLKNYVTEIFANLIYSKADPTPQKVFNVVETGSYNGSETTIITIPPVSTFDSATAIAFVQVSDGYVDTWTEIASVGSSKYYQKSYDMKTGLNFQIKPNNQDGNGLYSLETLSYLKTDYGFNFGNANGANESVTSGLVFSQANIIHVLSAPYNELPTADPSNFPSISIREIISNGTLTNSNTVLFTRKDGKNCFFKHFASLDVCSQSNTIGYQVQLTSRTSTLENRKQQFVLTCHKSSYQSGETTCAGDGSPESDEHCKCDIGYTGIDCKQKTCINGGTPDVAICRCPVPYYGELCENHFGTIPTTTPATTITVPTTVVSSQSSTKSTVPSGSSTTSAQSTLSTTIPIPTTSAPVKVRAVAFVLDVIGADDYAYNQTTQSIVEYAKAFSSTENYIMLVSNWADLSFKFAIYENFDKLLSNLQLFYNLRTKNADNKIASLNSALTKILSSYNEESTVLKNTESMNIFYLTQVRLDDSDNVNVGGLETFRKSSLVYSKFSQNADQSILDSLTKFSSDVTNVRDYYNGLKTMVTETENNDTVKLPEKPNLQCVYGLQSNIYVAIDRTSSTDQTDKNGFQFLNLFRGGFNFIEYDTKRCDGSALPDFYNERSAITAFAYYGKYARSTSFCPSQYTSYLNFTVSSADPPAFDSTMKFIGKYINQNNCACNRFDDPSTVKFVIWLTRSPAANTEEFRGYLKLNTTNAYHFVIPFYDVDKTNDVFYQILVDQDKDKPDFYLFPNSATITDMTETVSTLYTKLCQAAGVDPTAIPPKLDDIAFDSRHNYDRLFN